MADIINMNEEWQGHSGAEVQAFIKQAIALMQEIANGRALTGYRAAQSVSDLPTEGVDPTLGWIVGNHLYIYVEEGGDTLDGLYQDCGQLRGEKGDKGDKGNDAVVLEGVSLADSMEAVEEAETPSETVPTANAVMELNEVINDVPEKTKTRSTTTAATIYIYASDFGLTYFEKGTELTFTLGGAATQATLYAVKSDDSAINLSYIYNGTAKQVTVSRTDIKSYYAYSRTRDKSLTCVIPGTGGLAGDVDAIEEDVAGQQAELDTLSEYTFGNSVTKNKTINLASSVRRIEFTCVEGGFSDGDTVSFHLGDGLSSYNSRFYVFYNDDSYKQLQSASKQDWNNIKVTAPTGKTVSYYMWRFMSLTETSNPTISVSVYKEAALDIRFAEIEKLVESASPIGVNAVILGDSYSQMGYWVNSLKNIINFNQLYNFGVGGANLKDIKTNRTSYPYTDRPYQTKVMPNGDEGNYNLINCQWEWFKRLVNDECRGVYYELSFTAATESGSVTLNIEGDDYTASFNAGSTASEIAASVAALSIDGYTLIHPTGENYVTIEAMDAGITEMGTATATGTTVTRTKLRSAETPIFQDEGDYPDFIIVEAGKNDTPDTSTEVSEYMNDVVTEKTGYIKDKNSGSAHQGSCYVATPKEDVRRYTFCGELSYLVREVRELFSKAVLIVVGPSSLKGATKGLADEIKKDEQMRLACRYLNIPYVSWIDDGMINRVVNIPSGSGTQADPWIYNNATIETSDMLHPNARGGMKLAVAVAQKIRELISYRTLIKDYN